MNQDAKPTSIIDRLLMACVISVLFVTLLPMLIGELIAQPLEKHRHKSVAIWVIWNVLRISVPIVVVAFGGFAVLRNILPS